MAADPASRPSVEELASQLRHVRTMHGFAGDDLVARAEFEEANETASPYAPAPHGSDDRPRTVHSGRTGALPLELTNFIDRREESVEVKNLLSTVRMVTLTGMGGVGKTRLALRVADQARLSFADGVFLVELGELRDDSLVVTMVAETLGLRDRSARQLLEVLEDFLVAREVVLVLDNCERAHRSRPVSGLRSSCATAGSTTTAAKVGGTVTSGWPAAQAASASTWMAFVVDTECGRTRGSSPYQRPGR
nr:protein kinase/ transcriptional regulator, LuxR family [Rhodococcus sp. JVH1]